MKQRAKQMKKYVAFNPASSNEEEWWTANTLSELVDVFWSAQVTATEPTIRKIKKCRDGMYYIESIEIYNTIIHPKAAEGLV